MLGDVVEPYTPEHPSFDEAMAKRLALQKPESSRAPGSYETEQNNADLGSEKPGCCGIPSLSSPHLRGGPNSPRGKIARWEYQLRVVSTPVLRRA
jgi:hypothetical protein